MLLKPEVQQNLERAVLDQNNEPRVGVVAT